jgi:3-deoxy-D-manno-octulosonic-acid transferase
MGLFDFLGFNKLPAGVANATLVITDAATYARASQFITALQSKFHNVAIAFVDHADAAPTLPHYILPSDIATAAQRIAKAQPQRLIMLGLGGQYVPLALATTSPRYWINAQDASIAQAGCKLVSTSSTGIQITGALALGDPLADLDSLPQITPTPDICLRFKEQHESERWLGYFAATGEDEEDTAYALFSRAIRHKMGMMLLAPRDPARCEPVYRESIKYRLQTIRHARFSTSFVPLKTRVYYIEHADPLANLYGCVDFVVVGATLNQNAKNTPDITTPILHNRPVIVGAAHREYPLLAAAIAAGVVWTGDDNEQIFQHIKTIIDSPQLGQQRAQLAQAWLQLQVGAMNRVLNHIQ